MRCCVINFAAVSKVLLHKLLNREYTIFTFTAIPGGKFQLPVAIQLILRLAGFKMQLVANPQKEVVTIADDAGIFVGEEPHLFELFGIANSEACKSNPTQEVDVAQSTAGAFDIGLKQEHGFAELLLFIAAGFFDQIDQTKATADGTSAEPIKKTIEQSVAAAQESPFD